MNTELFKSFNELKNLYLGDWYNRLMVMEVENKSTNPDIQLIMTNATFMRFVNYSLENILKRNPTIEPKDIAIELFEAGFYDVNENLKKVPIDVDLVVNIRKKLKL